MNPIVAIPEYLQTNNTVSTRRTLTEALLAADVVPVVLPEMDDASADAVLAHCGAVMVGGGIPLQDYDRRCAFEDRVIELAVKRGLTIVGICHGSQVIDRHFGGTLSPVPEESKSIHKDDVLYERTGERAEHFAMVLPGDSLMARIFGEGLVRINSNHTMRCETLATGFRATALSEVDDVIEAFEHETLPIRGFQFHPEIYWQKDGRFLELIRMAIEGGARRRTLQ